MWRLNVLLIGLVGLAMASCSKPTEGQADAAREEAVVATTFYPTTYMAERLAGDQIRVVCPLPAETDPATWEPDADAMRTYQSASLVVINGASFEQWVAKAPLPRSRLVDTTAGVQDQLLKYETAVTHSHGTAGTHSHEGIDGHTWLDPKMAIAQAEALRDAMVEAFPEQAEKVKRNSVSLIADLRSLEQSLADLQPAMEGVTVVCTHPAYNYLGREYGWKLIVVTIDPDAPVSDAELEELVKACASAGPRRVVLWESPTSTENLQAIENAISAINVLYSPCEQAPEHGDFLSVMQGNIERLRAAASGG